MKSYTFGHSPLELPIQAYRFSNGGAKVLILGGVHGDEIEGVIAAHGLLRQFCQSFPYQLDLTLIPAFNIDGVLHRTRTNSRGVDLNRNLPTKDWSPEVKTPRYHPGPMAGSEPENRALAQFIETESPQFLLSLHSWHPVLNVNGDCLKEAESLARWTGYKIDSEIGYPTPGCLGTYAGLERQSPTLTYEIERGLAADKILQIHVPAIMECLKESEKRGARR
ncbi:MAG: M14 family zinc carboxypeptidase [Pseudobdellovibrionaceae bacterium]